MEKIINDKNLSLGAKAIIQLMDEVYQGESITLNNIQDITSDKPCFIRRVLKELLEGGFITRVKGRALNGKGEMKHGTFYSLAK